MGERRLSEEKLLAHLPPGGVRFEATTGRQTTVLSMPSESDMFDDDVLEPEVYAQLQDNFWYLQPEYAGRQPSEQWRIKAGGLALDMYNYVDYRSVRESEVAEIAGAAALFDAHFPLPSARAPKTIAITETLLPSSFKNPDKYATMAAIWPAQYLIEFATKNAAFRSSPYRSDFIVPTLAALTIHELSHLSLADEAWEEWHAAGFSWTPRLTASGKHQRKSYEYLYDADQPEACISRYAQMSPVEDICESAVAYLLSKRGALHAAKRTILAAHDRRQRTVTAEIAEVEPKIPRLPRVIRYRLQE